MPINYKTISIILLVIMFLMHIRVTFKLSYYEKKLELRGIEDGVKNLPWYKLWC